MGYSIRVTVDKPLNEETFDAIIQNGLSKKNQGRLFSKQAWGWSCYCDLRLEKKAIIVSGSYSASGDRAESTVEEVMAALDKLGYIAKADKSDF